MEKLGEYGAEEQGSLSWRVYHAIRLAIINGEYKPGDNLIETRLAGELGVSRTPVREALRQLELEELVLSVPNKGAVVVGVSEKDIDDIYAIRSLLEGLCVRWATERITSEQVDHLQEIVQLMEMYTHKNDYEKLTRLDTEFHDTVYKACDSRVLRHTLTVLTHNASRARMQSLSDSERAAEAVGEHREILSAMEKKESTRAEQLMIEHINKARKHMVTAD
ncbi:MAG: GntR family transcriptional regulator [Bacillota bacterium]